MSNIVIEGIPVDFNGDGVPRIRDIELAVRLGYKRPRKIRDLVARLIKEGLLQGVSMRPTVGRIQIRPGIERPATGHEYWLTAEQAIFVAAKSDTPIATEMLNVVIRVFLLAVEQRALAAAPAPAELPPPAPPVIIEPQEPPELRAAARLLGGLDPRVRAALLELPPPPEPSVQIWIEKAREFSKLVEKSDAPIPADPLTCARLAAALISALVNAPDHPVVLGTAAEVPKTVALVERLLSRAASDGDLAGRVGELRSRWSAEVNRILR